MKLTEFNPELDATTISDCDVVGLDGEMVLHFNVDDGTVYNAGLTLQDWLEGLDDSTWTLNEAEAKRVGFDQHDDYLTRLREVRANIPDATRI